MEMDASYRGCYRSHSSVIDRDGLTWAVNSSFNPCWSLRQIIAPLTPSLPGDYCTASIMVNYVTVDAVSRRSVDDHRVYTPRGGRVVRCRTCDREVAGSNPTNGCCVVYQRQLSVPSLLGRLMSTSEIWGVNGHTTRCIGPVSVVLRLRLVSGWGLMKRRSAPPHGP